ncbi:hypothetical protein ACS0TY_014757 [Phlomoides rotata]
MIYGIKLPKKSMRVSIDVVVDANALLPFQTSECKTVQDAIGSHVAWPVHLINLHIQTSQVSPNKNPNDHLTAQNFQDRWIWIQCNLCSQRKHTLEIKSIKCGWSGLNASNMKFK